jgi:putative oxidoreductase
MSTVLNTYGPLAGRILIAPLFLLSGFHKITGFSAVAGTTLLFHNFWAVDAAQYRGQLNHFMKNLAILGGLLYVMAAGSGPLSLRK